MKDAQRWDFYKKEYSPVKVPDNCMTYANDMDADVTCPNCNRNFKYGDMYTSRRWHTKFGMGFAVCSECHEEEWAIERETR